jgi:hypothetical protein
MNKICYKCNTEQPLNQFTKDKYSKDNHSGLCKACTAIKRKAWNTQNPGVTVAASKRWTEENPEKAKRIRRNSWLKHSYGITQDQYDEMLRLQNNQCAICQRPQSDMIRKFCVDHNHTTGEVRDLLCPECNSLIGMAKENKDILLKAISYIEKHNLKDLELSEG